MWIWVLNTAFSSYFITYVLLLLFHTPLNVVAFLITTIFVKIHIVMTFVNDEKPMDCYAISQIMASGQTVLRYITDHGFGPGQCYAISQTMASGQYSRGWH